MEDGVKFDKMKIAAVNAMPGVSFAATAVVEVDGVGPRLLLHGGQRRGLSKELWVFEAGDGVGVAVGAYAHRPPDAALANPM